MKVDKKIVKNLYKEHRMIADFSDAIIKEFNIPSKDQKELKSVLEDISNGIKTIMTKKEMDKYFDLFKVIDSLGSNDPSYVFGKVSDDSKAKLHGGTLSFAYKKGSKASVSRIASWFLVAEGMSTEEFIKKIEQSFKKNFSKGWFRPSKGALGGGMYIKTGIQSESKHSGGIYENDPAYQIIALRGVIMGKPLPEKIEVDLSVGASLTIKPTEGSHMAQGRVKFGWRKKTGTPEQILKHLDNYFGKMKKVFDANKDNMFEDHVKGI